MTTAKASLIAAATTHGGFDEQEVTKGLVLVIEKESRFVVIHEDTEDNTFTVGEYVKGLNEFQCANQYFHTTLAAAVAYVSETY